MKKNLILVVLLCISAASYGQILNPVKWSYASKKINDKEAVIFLKATIDHGWNIYAQKVPENGPVPTTFSFNLSESYQLNGNTNAPHPVVKHDPTFDMEIGYYSETVVFQQRVKLLENSTAVKGTLSYMACDDTQCLPPEEVAFNIPIK